MRHTTWELIFLNYKIAAVLLQWLANTTWRHLLLLAYGVIPGELNPLVRLNACHTQKLHTLHAVTCCLCVVITAHTDLSRMNSKEPIETKKELSQNDFCSLRCHEKLNVERWTAQEKPQPTNLAVFLHSAAWHLSRVFHKEIIQQVHFPAFLSAYWTSNGTYWSKDHINYWVQSEAILLN